MIGKKYGLLTVIEYDNNRKGYVICKCECGNVKSIRKSSLTAKKLPTKSCGCLQRQKAKAVGATTIAKNSQRQIHTNVIYNTNIQVISTDNPPKNNTSGHKGVSFDKSRGLWCAYIFFHYKKIHLGRFTNKDDAIKARQKAEELYFQPILEKVGADNNE